MAYTTVQNLRDEGVSVAQASDARLAALISRVSRLIDMYTGRYFEPRHKTVRLDGVGGRVLILREPIIAVERMFLEFDHFSEDIINEVDLEDVEVYNRHLTEGLLQPDDREAPKIVVNISDIARIGFVHYWPRGNKNVEIQGWFGYTDPAHGVLVAGQTEPYALADGQTLDVQVDGGEAQVVTFSAGAFVDIEAATAAEVATVISDALDGARSYDEGGKVAIESNALSASSSVEVTGGSAAAAFGFPSGPASYPHGVTPELITYVANMMVIRMLPVLTELDDHERLRRGGRVTELRTMDQVVKFGFGGTGNRNQHQDVGRFTGHPEIDNILAMYASPVIGAWT